jgi:hypothetical protein
LVTRSAHIRLFVNSSNSISTWKIPT